MMSALGQLGGRLYRGEVSFDFVGRQRLWYAISGLILVISIVAVLVRGLSFRIGLRTCGGLSCRIGLSFRFACRSRLTLGFRLELRVLFRFFLHRDHA